MTNTAPITLGEILAASQSTFINAQMYSTPLVISGNKCKFEFTGRNKLSKFEGTYKKI
jgi:hypothetical protein